jgi:hypothetical protein
MFLAQRLVHQPLTRKPDSSEAVEHLQTTHRSDKLKSGQRLGVTSLLQMSAAQLHKQRQYDKAQVHSRSHLNLTKTCEQNQRNQ